MLFLSSGLMRNWTSLLLAVSILILSGCRNNPRVNRQIEQMGSQRRVLEDQIYDLQYEYDKKLDEIKRLQQQNARLQRELNERDTPAAEVESEVDGGPALIDLSVGDQQNGISPEPLGFENPAVLAKENLRAKESQQQGVILPVSQTVFDEKPQRSSILIQSVEINRLRTVFRDADRNRLIDTVVLHITPRNAAGEFTPQADYAEIEIRENNVTGQLVGQWKVSRKELQSILAKSIYRTTIPLELELIKELDPATELFLEVRLDPGGVRTSGVLSSHGISTSRSHWTPYR
tara:strand:+ start:5855 stop:6724 length:870 start_codon:yes stop_codon:yes gene_type:complete